MSKTKISETRLGEQQVRAAEAVRSGGSSEECKSSGLLAWKIVGGMALAVAAVSVLTSLGDIRRYIKISTM